MTKDNKAIKSAAIIETVVCELCHRRFVFEGLVRHVKSNHKNEETNQNIQFNKSLAWCLSTEKVSFGDKQEFLNIALKLLCKTLNEAVVESMGSMLQKHMKPERNAKQTAFKTDMHIDWNGPVVSRADHLLSASLDC